MVTRLFGTSSRVQLARSHPTFLQFCEVLPEAPEIKQLARLWGEGFLAALERHRMQPVREVRNRWQVLEERSWLLRTVFGVPLVVHELNSVRIAEVDLHDERVLQELFGPGYAGVKKLSILAADPSLVSHSFCEHFSAAEEELLAWARLFLQAECLVSDSTNVLPTVAERIEVFWDEHLS